MDSNVVLAFLTAALTVGVVVVGIYRGPRTFVQYVFSLAMLFVAAEAVLIGFVYQTSSLSDFLSRHRLLFIVSSVTPAVWLLFSISFARANYLEQIAKWKWVLLPAAVVPLLIYILLNSNFILLVLSPEKSFALFIRLGRAGYLWHLLSIVISIIILMNLERTFRHSTGHVRWQTKFMFLGAGFIFAVRIFTDSQVILFNGLNTSFYMLNLGALIIADILILRSLFRGKPMSVSIQLSHQFLYTSLTVVIVGIYFIALGLITWIAVNFELLKNINLLIFLIFLTAAALAVYLLSDRMRTKRKRFISRHFKRPQYDYRKIWEDFTQNTASVRSTNELCKIIVKMISDTLEILSVTIWLVDEKQKNLFFGGSTVFDALQVTQMEFFKDGGARMIAAMSDQTMPVDLKGRDDDWASDLTDTYELETKESRVRYCVPLNAAGELIGIMTLSEKVFYEGLTFEETELIKTISDQAAAALLSLRFAEHLRQTKELEAFQTMSAFFMHDLKNLASKLSLVTQNLPQHINNPEFQADALKTISQSVTKINKMSGRLSLLSQKINLSFRETNINELVVAAINDLKGYAAIPVADKLDPGLPSFFVDQEQIYKVLENLLMNAYDATGADGHIEVATGIKDGRAEISVSDTGCGISREFMELSLFRPFQTTKKQGMGIGLYHCKTIVEAHGGRLEVESQEGRGSVFRVRLPLREHP